MTAIDRLREKMAPDPSRWQFSGPVRDTGSCGPSKCACEQPIRYEFPIKRDDGVSLIIGSTCIKKSVPYLMREGAKELAMDLQAADVQLERDLRRDQRERLAGNAVPGLQSDFAELSEWCRSSRVLLGRGLTQPEIPAVLRGEEQLPEPAATALETVSGIRRHYIAIWWEAVEAARMWDELALPPAPKDRPLLARLRQAIARNSANPKARLHRTALFAAAEYPALAPTG